VIEHPRISLRTVPTEFEAGSELRLIGGMFPRAGASLSVGGFDPKSRGLGDERPGRIERFARPLFCERGIDPREPMLRIEPCDLIDNNDRCIDPSCPMTVDAQRVQERALGINTRRDCDHSLRFSAEGTGEVSALVRSVFDTLRAGSYCKKLRISARIWTAAGDWTGG